MPPSATPAFTRAAAVVKEAAGEIKASASGAVTSVKARPGGSATSSRLERSETSRRRQARGARQRSRTSSSRRRRPREASPSRSAGRGRWRWSRKRRAPRARREDHGLDAPPVRHVLASTSISTSISHGPRSTDAIIVRSSTGDPFVEEGCPDDVDRLSTRSGAASCSPRRERGTATRVRRVRARDEAELEIHSSMHERWKKMRCSRRTAASRTAATRSTARLTARHCRMRFGMSATSRCVSRSPHSPPGQRISSPFSVNGRESSSCGAVLRQLELRGAAGRRDDGPSRTTACPRRSRVLVGRRDADQSAAPSLCGGDDQRRPARRRLARAHAADLGVQPRRNLRRELPRRAVRRRWRSNTGTATPTSPKSRNGFRPPPRSLDDEWELANVRRGAASDRRDRRLRVHRRRRPRAAAGGGLPAERRRRASSADGVDPADAYVPFGGSSADDGARTGGARRKRAHAAARRGRRRRRGVAVRARGGGVGGDGGGGAEALLARAQGDARALARRRPPRRPRRRRSRERQRASEARVKLLEQQLDDVAREAESLRGEGAAMDAMAERRRAAQESEAAVLAEQHAQVGAESPRGAARVASGNGARELRARVDAAPARACGGAAVADGAAEDGAADGAAPNIVARTRTLAARGGDGPRAREAARRAALAARQAEEAAREMARTIAPRRPRADGGAERGARCARRGGGGGGLGRR